MTDQEVCARFTEKLDDDLNQLSARLEPIVATHVAALPGSLPYPTNTDWDFFSAYWGSRELGETLRQHRVRLHVHGHIHSDTHSIPETMSSEWSRVGKRSG